jgi:hypothetical protein
MVGLGSMKDYISFFLITFVGLPALALLVFIAIGIVFGVLGLLTGGEFGFSESYCNSHRYSSGC